MGRIRLSDRLCLKSKNVLNFGWFYGKLLINEILELKIVEIERK